MATPIPTPLTSVAPLPDAGGGSESEFLGPDYTAVSSIDGVFAFDECVPTGSSTSQLVEIGMIVPDALATKVRSFTVDWAGQAGYHAGGFCNASNPPTTDGSAKMQIYSGGSWRDFPSDPTFSFSSISQTFSPLDAYLNSGKIWVRLYSIGVASSCSTIQTDFFSVTLTL